MYRETLSLVLRHLHDPNNEHPFALGHFVDKGNRNAQGALDFLIRVVQQGLLQGEGVRASAEVERLRQRVDDLEMTLEAIQDRLV